MLIVDCDGTAGWVNVDDWSVTDTGLSGEVNSQKTWFMGSQGFGYSDEATGSGETTKRVMSHVSTKYLDHDMRHRHYYG